MSIAIACTRCGGRYVSRDAWAGWDEDGQRWVLRTVFDYAYSHDCNAEARLEEQPLIGEHG